MSQGMNRVFLMGYLGADPEHRCTAGGVSVLSLRLATTETYLDKDKNRKERTDWHSVVMFGNRADALSRILHKGASIVVEGALRTSTYDDRDGNKRYKTEVHATNVYLSGRASGGEAAGGEAAGGAEDSGASSERRPSRPSASAHAPSTSAPGGPTAGDFEVPFGRDKGKRISEVADLTWLRSTIAKDLNDPSKEKYRANAAKRLASIDAELARRGSGGYRDASTHRGSDAAEPTAEEFGGGGDFSDDDVPF